MNRLSWIVMMAMIVVPAVVAVACPMCKDSIPNSDAEQAGSLPGGFNASIYYMLAGLFAVMGLMGFVITKGIRSTDRRMTNVKTRMTNQ
jgi:hypothetical protein